MNRTVLCVALGAVLPVQFAAGANSVPPTPVVVVTGSTAAYDARRDDTAARIVVGRDELTRFGDAGVADVLKRQPGITVDSQGAIAMRGLGKGYTQILLNGDRVPNGFSLDSISLDQIERIDITRVPTADQRNEAIAGTINIILRKAGRRSQRSATLRAMRTRGLPAGYFTAQAGEANGRLSWDLGATGLYSKQLMTWRSRTEGLDAAGRSDLARDEGLDMEWRARQLTLAPSATLKLDNGDTLSLQASLARILVDRDARGFSTTLLGSAHAIARDAQLAEERHTNLRAALEWAHKIAPGAGLNVKLTLTGYRRATDFAQQGVDGAGRRALDDRTLSGVRERSLKNSGRYSHRLNDAHALVAGWDAERTTRWQDRRQVLRIDGGAPVSIDFDFDAAIDQLALYAQDEWTVDERLAIYLGLRAERIGLRTAGTGFAPVRRSEDLISPSAQLLWKLGAPKTDQLRLGASRTFKAPQAMALVPRPFTSTNNSALTPDERGNPKLRPELALGLDGAWERHWAEGAMVSVGGYLRRLDGVTYDGLANENGRWVRFPVNGGRALLRGLELDTRFKLAHVMAQAPRVDLRLNLTRNWSSRDDLPGPDDRVAEQLRWSGTAGADWQASSRWSMGGSFSYKRGGWTRVALDRYVIAGSRRELDAYALYALAPGWKLRLSVANALSDGDTNGTRLQVASGVRQRIETRFVPPTLRAALEWSR